MKRLSCFACAIFLLLCLVSCTGLLVADATKISVDAHFGNHMVLQREKPICITGRCEAGKTVRVGIGKNTGSATADSNGIWRAILPPMAAGGPYILQVAGADGAQAVRLTDVLVGEVWLCSGQSNMEMPVYSQWPKWRDERHAEVLADAEQYPLLRLFNASLHKYVSPDQQQSQPVGMWSRATVETVAPFSATAMHFGMQLCKALPGVPVGLIHASWSGTYIEPWISWQGYRDAGRSREMADIARATMSLEEKQQARQLAQRKYRSAVEQWLEKFERFSKEPEAKTLWSRADYDDSGWQAYPVAAVSLFPNNAEGVLWARHAAEIPAEWVGQELVLDLGVIDDCDWTYVNGTMVGKTLIDTAQYWTFPRKYVIPASLVTSRNLSVAVRIANLNLVGGFVSGGKNMSLSLRGNPAQKMDIGHDWRCRMEFTADVKSLGGQPILNTESFGEGNPQFTSTLYNSMIHPWTQFPMRGAIWYQGCSNAGAQRVGDYLALQKLLIRDWRRAWNDPDFAFVITQLSGYERDFTLLREAQYLAMKQTPNTGLAVTIDIGDQKDIHPHNKADVGYRLACEAGRLCYGRTAVSAGPCFRSMTIVKDLAVLSFDNIGGGLVARGNADGVLNHFEVAGKDGVFYPAVARIAGDKVFVFSEKVPEPVSVRYGWVSYAPDLNFYNAEGFPACPFRTAR